jgi:hypothetical protein
MARTVPVATLLLVVGVVATGCGGGGTATT